KAAAAPAAAPPVDGHPAPAVPPAAATSEHREERDRRGEDEEQQARRVALGLFGDGLRRRWRELAYLGVAEHGARGLRALHDGAADVSVAQQRDEPFADDAPRLQVGELALEAATDLDANLVVVVGDHEQGAVVLSLLANAPGARQVDGVVLDGLPAG